MIWKILGKVRNDDIVGVLLKNRGIKTLKQKKEFFNPASPDRLKLEELGIKKSEVTKAVKRIKKAIKTREKVIVYGDYDADGICGTAVLWEALYSLGLNVMPYIPERFSEGYGLNVGSIKKLKKEDPGLGLIITVDHGIVANKKVDLAKELGIDVIITDHHEVGRLKPAAYAIVHTTKTSGSGVAWLLARELGSYKSLDLVAIGTVADQQPLLGPNRSFVKYGLAALKTTKRLGLLALFEEAGIDPNTIGSYEINFIIAPRLNAMGRLVHAIDSLRLLCTKNKTRASKLAAVIGRTNTQRQKIVEEVVLKAREKLGDKVRENVIVLAHESYHEGVIGLAAAKLVEEFYRPTIVLSRKKDVSKASARSVSGFDIIAAIRKLEHLYLEGGGHPMAAGFSIETSKIELFSREFNRVAKPLLTPEILSKKLKIDTEINFNRINYDLYKKLREFEPTGLGNFSPLFCTRGVEIVEARPVGREGKHLKLRLRQDSVFFDAIGFSLANGAFPGVGSRVDIAFTVEEDFWNGKQKLQLKIKDFKVR